MQRFYSVAILPNGQFVLERSFPTWEAAEQLSYYWNFNTGNESVWITISHAAWEMAQSF